jgi:hypothetical protein
MEQIWYTRMKAEEKEKRGCQRMTESIDVVALRKA